MLQEYVFRVMKCQAFKESISMENQILQHIEVRLN